MGIFDFWTAEAKDYVHGQLDATQCPPGITVEPVEPDAAYVEVVLRRMRIVNVRIGTKKFYGAVHSDLGLFHDSGQFVNFKSVITPDELKDTDAAHLDRVIVSNQPLLGPTPYRGGRLQLKMALLSVKSVDLAGPFLEVLKGLSSAAGVSYISVAEPFIQPLSAGIDLLTGTSGAATLEIQVVTNLKPLNSGVFVVLRAPSDELTLEEVRVQPDYTLAYSDGSAITKYPYMVITIESGPKRDDWKGIPEIKKAFDLVVTAVNNDKPDEYVQALAAFRRTALLSNDLLSDHALALVNQVQTKMDMIIGATKTVRSEEKSPVPSLDDFDPFESSLVR